MMVSTWSKLFKLSQSYLHFTVRMDFPEPVIKVSCEPTSQKDADKLGEALNKLAAEDPSFRYSRDEESNQTVIEGMGT